MGTSIEIRQLDSSAEALETRVERYLSGDLDAGETAAFEAELVQPELGRAFREILMIRELLRSAPPHDVPSGLNERIAEAIDVEIASSSGRESAGESAFALGARLTRDGFSWIYRGPAMALAGISPAISPDGMAGPDFGLSQEADEARARARGHRSLALRAAVTTAKASGMMGAWALGQALELGPPKPSLLQRLRGTR